MVNKENAKQQIIELLEKYNEVVEEKRFIKYNEEETKKDFIIPLFEALGWNIRDSSEVSAEETISSKRVDYGFRINGIPKFFLEAKAMKADLNKPEYAEQAINYAWHKGCTWAVLTNFESIKIFNAEWKTADLMQSRFISLEYDKFLERFDRLWLLSKESFEQKLLDKEAEDYGKKSKKSHVGEQLFSDLTKWRSELSKDISQRNKGINEVDLDEAVQRIIDRLIFIRNCEDRELDPPRLLPTVREWDSKQKGTLWEHVVKMFKGFDDDYNSKLFHPHPSEELDISNQVLTEVINGLYRTKDKSIRYDFSALDADVLGNVYEQYLGHILKKTAKRAIVEEKHAYRKEHGIYYTPTYIVDYIVRNTLGELLKDKKVNAEKIRVLDPACGSGSFLIKAFDILNEFYSKAGGDQDQTQLDLDTGLPFKKKEKILLNNIFGVDLDTKAVEIAQLNLLLKIAEKKQRLPLLQQNIKCGNSLIDDKKFAGDKAFDWAREFKQMTGEAVFDVIIGNPPYVRQEELSEIKPYLKKNYEVYHGMADLFVYFFEREMNLLKEGGYFGMIVSNKWLRAGYGANLRRFISKFWIEKFIDFGDLKVFPDATIYPCILILRKINKSNPKVQVCKMGTLEFGSLEDYVGKNQFPVNQNELGEKEWSIQSGKANRLLNKLVSSGPELAEYSDGKIYYGVKTGFNEAFVIDEQTKRELISRDPKTVEIIKPLLSGSEIKRYRIFPRSRYLIFTRRGIDIDNYQSIKKHLEKFKAKLAPKTSSSQKIGRKPGDYKWYEIQDVIGYYKEFEKPKIIWGNLTTKASFCFDKQGFYVNAPGCILPTCSKYVLGIMNSKLMSYFLKSICAERQGGFIEQKPVYVSKIPIKSIPEPKQKPIVDLVDTLLALNKRLNEIGGKKTDDSYRIEEEIKRTDAEIDELVYKLYGITESEKKIIEESLR